MKVMVNGLTGKMATKVAEHVIRANDLELFTHSLTGPDITEEQCVVDHVPIELIRPEDREAKILELLATHEPFVAVDFVKDPRNPNLPNDQADFYCKNNLPFVMGSVGGDRDALEQRVKASNTSAVIAPNMGKQIVALQGFMQHYAETHPNAMQGYELAVVESHQKSKGKETSGTAKAMVKYFNALGIKFEKEQITMIREPEEQLKLGVPEEYLDAHGWHTYDISPATNTNKEAVKSLADKLFGFLSNSPVFEDYKRNETATDYVRVLDRESKDETVLFRVTLVKGDLQIRHNVNGRYIYAAGTLDAVRFLQRKIEAGEKGKVYSMINVLKEA